MKISVSLDYISWIPIIVVKIQEHNHLNTKNKNLCIILVEPQGPINIGSVCRVMMNFSISQLRLVNPCKGYLGLDARRMALKAETLLKDAVVFQNLKEALKDCHGAIGTTRRFGKYRNDFLLPDQAATWLSDQPGSVKSALVFGREDRGLHTDELELCQFFLTIPTSRAYPSMNLAQSVAVCLYEISKATDNNINPAERKEEPATGDDLERMYRHMRETLLEIEYLDPLNPDHILRTFRRIFGRAGLSERDVRILQGLWRRIDWVEGERKKGLLH